MTTLLRALASFTSWRTVLKVCALGGLLAVTACDPRTTGVTQLPVPPSRDLVSIAGPPPSNGPPIQSTNDCKSGTGNYRLGTGDKIRVIVLQDTEFSGDYEVNATGSISA